jgi:hypothetical protein
MHLIDVSLDVSLDELKLLLSLGCRAHILVEHELLLLRSFLNRDNLVRLMCVTQDAINAQDLKVLLTKCFKLLSVNQTGSFALGIY